ncbi:NAD(P)/FAD-dependent oxidoreductase [Mycobacterium paraterrae]|uniref:NAD(P)/FAD-dependent oxidoreductase n=1 Tax=Mycobacterium paraterrae TaxID=577492 RepID=A0ABY3VTC4_9MYCO|nr:MULTISPECIES: NAD(P)/FAD-dependent oxidoreductase [Mycobacteriaceae]UMB71681.1 NAD(P)/FAD-dependent oxidoreductase [Mycobacterium paraterrae]
MIIGAGVAGIAMAHQLKRDGFTNFTMVEQAADIGGVWRDNTYPGAACDVPSALYSLSDKPNTRWSRRYAEQPEILQYLRRLVLADGMDLQLRTRTEVVEMTFDEQAGRWRLVTGSSETIWCDVVISAVGQLSRPHTPNIAGEDTFEGPRFHSARWDHSVSLRGKEVAVIGTGASAIQFVPRIAHEAQRVTLYQRTAPWILPKWDSRYGRLHQQLIKVLPLWLRLERFAVWLIFEVLAVTLVDAKPLSRILGAVARYHLHRQVADPMLRRQLTPSDAPGCKRVLFSNDYYPAIANGEVSLVTNAVAKLCDKGVVTDDGVLHRADVVIYGTGFRATDFLAPMRVRGWGGVTLDEVWGTQAHAYLGITVPMFPNLFLLYGPNTNVGSGSIIYMIESQVRYVGALIKILASDPGRTVDVRPDIEQSYNTRLSRRLRRSVWALCASWYTTSSGAIPTNWPGPTFAYRILTRKPRSHDYLFRHVERLQLDGPSENRARLRR